MSKISHYKFIISMVSEVKKNSLILTRKVPFVTTLLVTELVHALYQIFYILLLYALHWSIFGRFGGKVRIRIATAVKEERMLPGKADIFQY